MTPILEDGDPRLAGESDELAQSSTRAEPAVARSAQRSNTSLIAAAFVLGGVILFATLNAARAERGGGQLLQPASTAPSPMVEAPLPQGLTPTPISLIIPTTTPVPVQPAGAASYAVSPPPRFGGGGGGGGRPQVDMAARFRAPAVVVELSQATTGPSTNAILLAQAQGADGLPTGAVVLGGSAPAGRPTSTSDEQFARQVGDAEPERARATFMGALDTLVPQGTVIPGVLARLHPRHRQPRRAQL